VSIDVLTVGGLRVGVTPRLAQAIADEIGLIIPTPKIDDAIWAGASVVLPPFPQSITDPLAEQKHNAAIDAAIAGRSGLRAPLGKIWALCKEAIANPSRACNYGWQTTTKPPAQQLGWGPWSSESQRTGVWVLQANPVGGASMAHNAFHWDYSQTFRAIDRRCLLDGNDADVGEILTGPNAGELSWEGTLSSERLPYPFGQLSALAR
jgi:hypothetical protein